MLSQWCSEEMPPWFYLFLSNPALVRGVGKGRTKDIVHDYVQTTKPRYGDIIFFHWQSGGYCVLTAKSPLANMGVCSILQVVTLCLRNCSGSYPWLCSKTFLCVFPPVLQGPPQFMISYHWINWKQSWFQFISCALTCPCSLASTQGFDLSHQQRCRGQEGQALLLQPCGEVSPPRIQCSRSPSANMGNLVIT